MMSALEDSPASVAELAGSLDLGHRSGDILRAEGQGLGNRLRLELGDSLGKGLGLGMWLHLGLAWA